MDNKEFLKIVQAYEDGKPIEQQMRGADRWSDFDGTFNCRNYVYRIKPEEYKPKYRPYQLAEEVLEGMKKYSAWVKLKKDNTRALIISYSDDCICIGGRDYPMSYGGALMEYTWLDGTPFGKPCCEITRTMWNSMSREEKEGHTWVIKE